jgi:hypothetical protein
MWLRVNLTRNHITKHRIIFKYLGPRANLISDWFDSILKIRWVLSAHCTGVASASTTGLVFSARKASIKSPKWLSQYHFYLKTY